MARWSGIQLMAAEVADRPDYRRKTLAAQSHPSKGSVDIPDPCAPNQIVDVGGSRPAQQPRSHPCRSVLRMVIERDMLVMNLIENVLCPKVEDIGCIRRRSDFGSEEGSILHLLEHDQVL